MAWKKRRFPMVYVVCGTCSKKGLYQRINTGFGSRWDEYCCKYCRRIWRLPLDEKRTLTDAAQQIAARQEAP